MSEQPGQGAGGTGTPGRPDLPERGDSQDRPGFASQPSEQPGKDPGKGESADRTGIRSLWLGGGALMISLLGFFPAGILLGIPALVVGFKARKAARRQQTQAPGAVAGIALGSAGLAVSAIFVAGFALVWPQWQNYQECRSAANTHTDTNACVDTFIHAVEDKFGQPRGTYDGLGKYLKG
ncbi:DUF4190 domain-containing protein [Spirillospora sp. NPDC047279]|uniref:DUF4190 domain-containing protein n=1 Tax=Spirillospora sp. NPDC047279 TaxID=3155478 RepID=UPI0033F7BEFB